MGHLRSQKLRILLNSKYFYLLLVIPLIYIIISIINFNIKLDEYYLNSKEHICVVKDYFIDGTKIKFSLKCDYHVNGYYYLKDEDDLLTFKDKCNRGDLLKIYGSVSAIESNTNPNLFNYREYEAIREIFYNINIDKLEIIGHVNLPFLELKNLIMNKIEGLHSYDYLMALLLGNKNYLDRDIKDVYKSIGVIHLFAISGMHVGIFCTVINKITRKNNLLNFLACTLFLIIYYNIIGSISLLRSLVFFFMQRLNKILKLGLNNLKTIILIIITILLFNPYYFFDIGFRYSILISSSLVLLSKKIDNKKGIKKLFYISYLSFFISLPLNIYYNYEINFLAIIYNIILVPFVSMLLFPLSLFTVLFPFLDIVMCFLINVMEYIANVFSSIPSTIVFIKPNICILIVYYIVIFLCLRYSKKFIAFVLIMLLIHKNYNFIASDTYVLFLDVGQGDCILIHNKNTNVLIDTGGVANYLSIKSNDYSITRSITMPVLKSLGIDKIDSLILTHGDYDHMGEAINLVSKFKVEKVIFNNDEYNNLELELIEILENKDINYYKNVKELTIENNELFFLNTGIYDNENDNSNIIYANINGSKLLFMGDAGVEVEKNILKKYNISNIDIFKVGHHGSDTSTSEEFINVINPKYFIISVGKNNRYGHPKDKVLNILEDSQIYRTDIDGSIEIKINKNGYKVRPCNMWLNITVMIELFL